MGGATEPCKRRLGIWIALVSSCISPSSRCVTRYHHPLMALARGVRMGTQESAQTITEVGAAFWYGFAFSDLVIYIPLLGIGLIGQLLAFPWWRVVLSAALGITVYWPLVVLATAVDARDASGWNIDETDYWIVLPLIAVWALFGLFLLARTAGDDTNGSQ